MATSVSTASDPTLRSPRHSAEASTIASSIPSRCDSKATICRHVSSVRHKIMFESPRESYFDSDSGAALLGSWSNQKCSPEPNSRTKKLGPYDLGSGNHLLASRPFGPQRRGRDCLYGRFGRLEIMVLAALRTSRHFRVMLRHFSQERGERLPTVRTQSIKLLFFHPNTPL